MAWTNPITWVTGLFVTDVIANQQFRDNMNYLFSSHHPVGSIYIETTGVNPGTTFGFGTWVAFGAGRVLVGVGTSDAVYAAGATGGESKHALTSAENGAHTHVISDPNNPSGRYDAGTTSYVKNYDDGVNTNTGSSGSGTPHNNMPPYIVCYFWRRTA
jgi:microcystin-dependent protein